MIIDAHAHWLSTGLREWGWQLLSHGNASDKAMPMKGVDEENARNIQCMDERGIDMQIVSIRPVGMLSHENPYINIPWSRVFNNVLAKAIERNPKRLQGLALLPQSDMTATLEELERTTKELKLRGAIFNPNPPGNDSVAPLDDEYWYPLYAKAQELDVPLFLHAAGLRGERYRRYRATYMIGQTVEETIAGPTLVYGGIMEQFPRLKMVLAHAGGGTTFQIGRYLTPPGREEENLFGDRYKGSFLDGYKKLYFDGTLYTKDALELLIRVVGPDRVLFGTEAPGRGTFVHEGRMLDDLVPLVNSIDWLSEADRKKITEGTARELFKLDDV